MIFSQLIELCSHHHNTVLEHLYHPNPRQQLSLQISLFWTFHINGIVKYTFFQVWLLSFSIMLSRFMHVTACINTSFFFIAK